MSARWWTLVVWALAAASAAFWGLRLFVAAPPVPPNARTAEVTPAVRGDLTRLFGVDAPPPVAEAAPEPAADARFQLIGVVSPRAARAAGEGLALIAVDGKPARAYRVGAVVDGTQVLKSVHARGAMLGTRDGPAAVALNLAPPAPAATGSLPPAGAAPAGMPQAAPQRPVYTQPNDGPIVPGRTRHPPISAQGEQKTMPPNADNTLTR
jgi:general secretion pathway protein C